jgi:aminomuconate-semialdehyde/2-hydroxymuconate-6-semialdehyde dehydrogenase
MTTVTAWMLCQVFDEVGLPKGVLNLVCGLGTKAGEALVTHPDVKIISFTGSTLVGQRIASLAGMILYFLKKLFKKVFRLN